MNLLVFKIYVNNIQYNIIVTDIYLMLVGWL